MSKKSTILHRLMDWAESKPQAIAQRYKKNGNWQPISAEDFRDRVYWLALYLESRGMTSREVGTIFSYNCPEWVHVDLAVLLLGGKAAGIYPNSTAKDILYILNHTETKLLAVQNKEYFKRIVGDQGESSLPEVVQLILVFDGDTTFSSKAVSYETALAQGRKLAEAKGAKKCSDYLAKIDPHAGAFLIYTSGTTGDPKGALLSHDNLIYAMDVVESHWELPFEDGSLFSFLPLCHIAEILQNIGAGISQRYTVNFCTKFENVSVELPEVQPTLLLCVPRLWEKMMEGVMHKVKQSPVPRRILALWALSTGKRVSEAKYSDQNLTLADRLQWELADRLVLSKIRVALGISEAKALASGAAVLPVHVCKWFQSLGMEVMEDFGQTESTGIICMTERGTNSAGTVGKAPAGIEVKIAEDGEILTRGRHVFKGYYKDEAATAAVLVGGWLHTGDLGEYDERGLIRILGRKKEILKTSGGKMIAPLPIEEKLKTSPLISQVCMVGDGRKYLSALITLSEPKLEELKKANGALNGVTVTVPQVVSEVKKHIDEVNASLASYAQIKKFAVLSKEFSIADGEMTPTLKMKRNVIEKRYYEVINQLYE